MNHLIPYPNFTAMDDRNKLKQMESYLFQLREALELSLTDIGPENFSAAFRVELERIGMEMQNVQTNAEESQQRVEQVSGSQLTVSDVLNSEAYKKSIDAAKSEGDTGYVRFPDGTMICYGSETDATLVTFAKAFSAVPVTITSLEKTVIVTTTGLTMEEAATFSWIAIGRYEKGETDE